MSQLIAFVVRGSRWQAHLTDPITNRHIILYAMNEHAALKQACALKLAGEMMAVVGRCYFLIS